MVQTSRVWTTHVLLPGSYDVDSNSRVLLTNAAGVARFLQHSYLKPDAVQEY
jgi:hypothetical protein